MGARQITIYEDSLDGKELKEEDVFKINLTVGRTSWELTLSEKNAEKFNDEIKKWTEREEPLSKQEFASTRKTVARSAARTDPAQLAEIRTWARDHGFEVSDRGRIAQSIRDAYAAAH